MGIYNPNKPTVLGMEWVPVADSLRPLDIQTEIGYGFTVTGAPFNELRTATIEYEVPQGPVAGQVLFYNVYERGREADVGEIRYLDNNASNVQVTGVTGPSTSLVYPSDNDFYVFDSRTDRLRCTFGLPAAALNKRILGIDILYQMAGTPGSALKFTIENNLRVYDYGPVMTGPPTTDLINGISSFSIGEVNPFWNNTADPNTESSRYPWRYTDLLARFTGGFGTNFLWFGVQVDTLPPNGSISLGYLAMRIYFCDESRVLYGGIAIGDDPDGTWAYDTPDGLSAITLRTPTFQVTGSLTAGDYTVTATLADAGEKYNAGYKTRIPVLFQDHKVSTHPTYQVEKFKRVSGILPPAPPEREDTDYMASVALRSSGTTSTGTELQAGNAPVTYTFLWGMPVYINPAGSSVTAVQEIHNLASASDTSYEYVRFYARRFNEDGPGDLQVSVAGSGSATITAAEFAALEPLTNEGWKEVTLPITAVFSSDSSFRDVTFTMTGVSTGKRSDQYQILSSLVRSVNAPDAAPSIPYRDARYDGWQQAVMDGQLPDNVTDGTSNNSTSGTMIVLFSQASDTVTGVGTSIETQALEVASGECIEGSCIPTGLDFVRISWGALPSTSFKNSIIEIQRQDDLDDDWQQIYYNDYGDTHFDDYEARVGVFTEYRIRAVNELGFPGAWTTVNATIPTPGVTVSGDSTGNSVLLFTSNHGPTGNLAYVMQFEGDAVEEFVFPEAGFQQLRTQYQRDFFVAMRPTERGGVQFSRTILVNNVAIPVPSLDEGFRSLRDLAWADLPYVCVRDELGNRWFANVAVPGGRVRDRRTTYLGQIIVTEVTATPAPYGSVTV